MQLNTQQCEACRSDVPCVPSETAEELKKQLPDWAIVEHDGISLLERSFTFKNFVEALSFTCLVGDLAERNNHHPALLTEWGKTTVQWWTHKIKGLHMNDFILAAKTDAIFNQKK